MTTKDLLQEYLDEEENDWDAMYDGDDCPAAL